MPILLSATRFTSEPDTVGGRKNIGEPRIDGLILSLASSTRAHECRANRSCLKRLWIIRRSERSLKNGDSLIPFRERFE